MEQKVIIVKSRNIEPQEEANQALAELGPGWRVVLANTTIAPWGEMKDGWEMRHALHLYMVTTMVVQKEG